MRTLLFSVLLMLFSSGVARATDTYKLEITVFKMVTANTRAEFAPGSSLFLPTARNTNTVLVAAQIMVMVSGESTWQATQRDDRIKAKLVCGTTTKTQNEKSAEANEDPSTDSPTGTAVFEFTIDSNLAEVGDRCRFEAETSIDATDDNMDNGVAVTASFPFVVGCSAAPCLTARGGVIKEGQPFTLDNIIYEPDDGDSATPPPDNRLDFGELRLENCTAGSDPELFIATDTALQRAYPVLVGTTVAHPVAALRHEDGADWGTVANLFFIGSGAGCSFTFYRAAIIGGHDFTASCPLRLADTAAVTASNGKVMVNLGVKPSNASDTVTVFTSANGGYTWHAWGDTRNAAVWGTKAQDSGIAAGDDNTKNRALVKITHTDGSVCWHVINGA